MTQQRPRNTGDSAVRRRHASTTPHPGRPILIYAPYNRTSLLH